MDLRKLERKRKPERGSAESGRFFGPLAHLVPAPSEMISEGNQQGGASELDNCDNLKYSGPLAHLVEQETLNLWAAGSSPAWPINFLQDEKKLNVLTRLRRGSTN